MVPKLRFKDEEGKEFPEWEDSKLGEIASFFKGKGISKSDIIIDGLNPCIRYGELYTHYNEKITKIISYTNVHKSYCVLSKENDIIIPSSGETSIDIARASCVLLDGVILGGDLNIIRSKQNGVFLSYYLNNAKKLDIAQLAQGNSVVHLYNHQLEILQLKLPRVQEQTKIANFLSAIDDKIEQLTRQHTLLSQYKKGMMQKIFSQELRFKDEDGKDFPEWNSMCIGNCVDFLSGYPFDGGEISEVKTEKKLMRGINITEGKIRHNSEIDRFFTGDARALNKYKLRLNDIVIGMDGSKVGKNIALITIEDENSLLVQRVARLREIDGFSIKFIFQILLSKRFYNYVDSVKTSSAIPHISQTQIKNFNVQVPNLKEQTKIANFLSAIDDKIEQQQSVLNAVKEYKRGLLQQMFI